MKTRKANRLGIGSISEGTCNPVEIIDSLLYELERIRLTRADRVKVGKLRREYDALYADPDVDVDGERETATNELLDDLTAIGQGYVPDYCSLGNHPGDGADFGVWPDWDVLDDGFAFKGERADCPAEFTHCVEVNDHGNTSVYRRAGRRWVLCWNCV